MHFAPGRRYMKKNPIYIRSPWSLWFIRQFPTCNSVWTTGPAWNPNREKKSRCGQRARKTTGLKGMLVCNLAAMRPSREAGNLKERKTYPLGSSNERRKVFPEESHSLPAHSPLFSGLLFQEGRGGRIHCGQAPTPPFPEGRFYCASPEGSILYWAARNYYALGMQRQGRGYWMILSKSCLLLRTKCIF